MQNNNELVNMLRAVIHEELKPIDVRLAALEQGQLELQQGQQRLEQGQRKLQKDVTTIKKEVSAIWDDIKKLDNRLLIQEERAIR